MTEKNLMLCDDEYLLLKFPKYLRVKGEYQKLYINFSLTKVERVVKKTQYDDPTSSPTSEL